MSVTRQQRRQQLLNELESVRHLLQEPSDESLAAALTDSIPTLSEVMPSNAIKSSATHTDTAIPLLANAIESVISQAPPTAPLIELQPNTTESATPDSNAMQLLIAKLTQRPTIGGSTMPTDNTAENLANLLFTPVAGATATQATAALPLLFQPMTETPVFQAPTFTELELRQPQFIPPQPQISDAPESEAINTATADETLSSTASDSINQPAIQHSVTMNADDIEQLLFDIMPAVEELLRKHLSARLLNR